MLGPNVVVENRPGAGGAIADEAVARSAADGYTVLYAAGSSAILPSLRAKLPYDIERDLAPVSLVVITSFALTVHPSVPVHDVEQLIALARAQPGKLTFFCRRVVQHDGGRQDASRAVQGTAGSDDGGARGPDRHCLSERNGRSPARLGRQVEALGVSSAKRASLFPNVPTLNEAGVVGYERLGWNGVLVPAAVPTDIIARLNTAIVRGVNTPEMKDAFMKQGLELQTGTPEQFGAFIRKEIVQNAKTAKFAGIRAE